MADNIITEKLCPKCHETKDLSDFIPNKAYKLGVGSWCRLCTNTLNKKRRHKPALHEPDLPGELWVTCVQSDDYAVSNMGRVKRITFGKSVRPKRILTPVPTTHGYREVSLGARNRFPVHQLVCRAFHGEPPTPQHEPNHKDSDRTNNRADNLEWVTRKENLQWAKQQGRNNRGDRNGHSTITESDVLQIIHLLKTTQQKHGDIGKQCNASDAVVQSINVGRAWAYLTTDETFPLQKRG